MSFNIKEIASVRILPMDSKNEFKNFTITDVQIRFFFNELPGRNGIYYYKTLGLSAEKNSLILFQFDGKLIGMAVLLERIKFKENYNKDYSGFLKFDVNTIAVFDEVSITDLKEYEITDIYGKDIVFSQIKHNISYDKVTLEKLEHLLSKKNIKYYYDYNDDEYLRDLEVSSLETEDIDDTILYKPVVKSDKFSFNIKSARNLAAAKRVIIKSNYLCEVSPSHPLFVSRISKRNYLEAHHLIPMKYQDFFKYSLDVESNIIALCPMCHRKFHHADRNAIEEDIKALFKERKEFLEMCNISVELEKLLEFY